MKASFAGHCNIVWQLPPFMTGIRSFLAYRFPTEKSTVSLKRTALHVAGYFALADTIPVLFYIIGS